MRATETPNGTLFFNWVIAGSEKIYYSRQALTLTLSQRERELSGSMRFILISLLKLYKAVISPWLPPSCRFVPTCSEYAREAIERYGALRGSGMAVWRLLRCQPFCEGGYDPVK